MFKFFRENILKPIQEGMEEGRQELEAEQAGREQEWQAAKQALAEIPQDEKFAMGVAAPFRVTVFGDWFSVFKDNTAEDGAYPLHLYTFGQKDAVTPEQVMDLQQALERDFDAADQEGTLRAAGRFLALAQITTRLAEEQDAEQPGEWADNLNVKAACSAVAAYILTSGVDTGFIGKIYAMDILRDIADFVHANYAGWQAYGDAVLLGEEQLGLNGRAGRKLLRQYVGYLRQKQGSPWNQVAWQPS